MSDTKSGRSPLTSVIVPCWNQREFTRHCITALMRHTRTRSPWELIVVDNGSTDGTRDYLAGVQDAAPVPVTVIANSTNIGFPAAINQGLARARGEYLVLLNNDAVVTDAWLVQLIALTRAVPRGGEAGAGTGAGTHLGEPACADAPTLSVGEGGETCGHSDGGVRRPAPNAESSPDLEATSGAEATPSPVGASEAIGSAESTLPGPQGQRALWAVVAI